MKYKKGSQGAKSVKLECLHDGSVDCPLIRLYGFTIAEAEQFLYIINQLSAGNNYRVEIHNLPWVEVIGNCHLTLFVQNWDQSVVRKKGQDENNFECGFTTQTWCNIEGLVEPFAKGRGGFQWLAGIPGEAAILLSCDGGW